MSAILHILLKGEKGQAYNVADNESNISIKELAETIAEIGHQKVVIDLPTETEKLGFNVVKKSIFSTQKLEGLGWHTIEGSIKNNLKKTIDELSTRNKK